MIGLGCASRVAPRMQGPRTGVLSILRSTRPGRLLANPLTDALLTETNRGMFSTTAARYSRGFVQLGVS